MSLVSLGVPNLGWGPQNFLVLGGGCEEAPKMELGLSC